MGELKYIVNHHSGTDFGDAKLINKNHLVRFGPKGIGYHIVILNGKRRSNSKLVESLIGHIEYGRPFNDDKWIEGNEVGAQALGYNFNSIGICAIHEKGIYNQQLYSRLILINASLAFHFDISIENIKGHCELDSRKPVCPGYDMNQFRYHVRMYIQEYKNTLNNIAIDLINRRL